MRVNQVVACPEFPCQGVDHEGYLVPDVGLNPDDVRLVLISEAAPPDASDYYYAPGDPLFQQTTVQAFRGCRRAMSRRSRICWTWACT